MSFINRGIMVGLVMILVTLMTVSSGQDENTNCEYDKQCTLHCHGAGDPACNSCGGTEISSSTHGCPAATNGFKACYCYNGQSKELAKITMKGKCSRRTSGTCYNNCDTLYRKIRYGDMKAYVCQKGGSAPKAICYCSPN